MAGFKFNFALEDTMQNFQSYHMILKFSKDADSLLIYNRKPVSDYS
jgi:hypothetical protein